MNALEERATAVGVVFRRVKEIPGHLIPQLQNAIRDFMVASHLPEGVDPAGFFESTVESLAAATYLNSPGHELWIGTMGDQLTAYVMATITKEIDNKLTYWVFQAWVRRDQRTKRWVQKAWQMIRQRAKDALCSHMVVVSSRNDDAYCRWLGRGKWHRYASLLKEDL